MHIGNGINKIVCAFTFSDGFKSKSAYNKSSAPERNKATRYYAIATIQFYFRYAQYSGIPVGKGRMVPCTYIAYMYMSVVRRLSHWLLFVLLNLS